MGEEESVVDTAPEPAHSRPAPVVVESVPVPPLELELLLQEVVSAVARRRALGRAPRAPPPAPSSRDTSAGPSPLTWAGLAVVDLTNTIRVMRHRGDTATTRTREEEEGWGEEEEEEEPGLGEPRVGCITGPPLEVLHRLAGEELRAVIRREPPPPRTRTTPAPPPRARSSRRERRRPSLHFAPPPPPR